MVYVFNGNTEENNYPFLTILPEITDDKPVFGGYGTDIQLHSTKRSIGAQDSSFNNCIFMIYIIGQI